MSLFRYLQGIAENLYGASGTGLLGQFKRCMQHITGRKIDLGARPRRRQRLQKLPAEFRYANRQQHCLADVLRQDLQLELCIDLSRFLGAVMC